MSRAMNVNIKNYMRNVSRNRLTCIACGNYNRENCYCVICSCKPPITGDPETCPYYRRRQ